VLFEKVSLKLCLLIYFCNVVDCKYVLIKMSILKPTTIIVGQFNGICCVICSKKYEGSKLQLVVLVVCKL